MLSVETLRGMISALDREDRIKLALFMLGISQSEIAESIGRAHISVRKALNRIGSGRHDDVLDEIEAEIESRISSSPA